MKVCVTSVGNDMSAQVDLRFGRAPFFVFIDLNTGAMEAFENPNIEASGGAGILSAQFVAEKGAAIVLTGHVGPNAFKTLNTSGISMFVGIKGSVEEALKDYQSGALSLMSSSDSQSKSGLA